MAALHGCAGGLKHAAYPAWSLRTLIPDIAPRVTPVRRGSSIPSCRQFTAASVLQTSHDLSNDPVGEQWIQAQPQSSEQDLKTNLTGLGSTDPTSNKPWYLQIQDAQFGHPNPIAARQQLPEFPDDPPLMLEGLLNHLSIDIGLDYLSLVDLRSVDPPPALGSNLIMIFGTTRSEKHLHVSADRFCRWLRTEHKLTPFADGLLGRNEFKLKMRRKLRRTKVLSAAGARDLSSGDDGISTGWVCVNAGSIDETSVAEEELANGAIGFGKRSNGTKLVVQMMTEEKRGDLDLEGLWTGVLKGSLRRQSEIAGTRSSPPMETSVPTTSDSGFYGSSPRMMSRIPPAT